MATPIHINFVRNSLIVPIYKLLTVPKRYVVSSIRGRLAPGLTKLREFREIFAKLSM